MKRRRVWGLRAAKLYSLQLPAGVHGACLALLGLWKTAPASWEMKSIFRHSQLSTADSGLSEPGVHVDEADVTEGGCQCLLAA